MIPTSTWLFWSTLWGYSTTLGMYIYSAAERYCPYACYLNVFQNLNFIYSLLTRYVCKVLIWNLIRTGHVALCNIIYHSLKSKVVFVCLQILQSNTDFFPKRSYVKYVCTSTVWRHSVDILGNWRRPLAVSLALLFFLEIGHTPSFVLTKNDSSDCIHIGRREGQQQIHDPPKSDPGPRGEELSRRHEISRCLENSTWDLKYVQNYKISMQALLAMRQLSPEAAHSFHIVMRSHRELSHRRMISDSDLKSEWDIFFKIYFGHLLTYFSSNSQ
jgi:hypothetical protein